MAQSQRDSTYTLLLRAYECQTIVRFFSLQFEFGYPLPVEHVRFLMERILYGLINSPFTQINVMITLAICDADTELNRVYFRIFLCCFTRENSKLLQYFYGVSPARHLRL